MRLAPLRVAAVLLLTVGSASIASPAFAADPASDFTVSVSGASATITGYVGGKTVVDIPSTVSVAGVDYAVTAIGINAFRGNSLPQDVTAVTIPDSVVTIGDNAFRGDLLTSVVIPDSVVSIGTFAFYNNQLTSVNFGDSLTTLSNNSFRGNYLTALTIPASVTSIGNNTFADNATGANSLTSVIFEGSAPSITAAGGSGSFTGAGPTVYYYAGTTGFSALWNGYVARQISAARSSITVDPTGAVVADGNATSTATITVRDDVLSPVAGVPVSLAAPAGLSASSMSCTTAADGTCSVALTSVVAGSYVLAARIGSDPTPLTVTIRFAAVAVAPVDLGVPAPEPAAELAATGIDVAWPLASGLLALIVGLGLLASAATRLRMAPRRTR